MHMPAKTLRAVSGLKPRTIFFHIPKTAGMTLRGLFVRNYRRTAHFNTDLKNLSLEEWQGCLQRLRNMPKDELDRYGVFKGHMIFGLHEALPWPAGYITFLREPVSRVISHYQMVRLKRGYPSDYEIDLSKADWNLGVNPAFLRALDNYQTRALSGADFEIPFGACMKKHLKLAKENMDRHFKFVGLTEQFDLSLMLLRKICGWGWRYYVPDNVAPKKSRPVPPNVVEAFRELNGLDSELYRYARERFERLVKQYGWKLKTELDLYRLGNSAHQSLHRLRHKAQRQLGIERRRAVGT